MNCKLISFLILLCFNNIWCQPKFSEFLLYLDTLPYNQKEIVVDSFMAVASKTGLPIIENNSVYFLYRGEDREVYITGNFIEQVELSNSMTIVQGTDLQYYRWNLPPDTNKQSSYQLKISQIADKDISKLVNENRPGINYNFEINATNINEAIYYNIIINDYSDMDKNSTIIN